MQTREIWRSRWWMPAFALFLGALMFVAFAIGGDAGQGAISFGIMAALAAMFAFGRRSETLQGIGGPGRDERWELIDLRATALTGMVLIIVRHRRLAVRGRQRAQDGEPVRADRRDRRRCPTSSRWRCCAAFVIAVVGAGAIGGLLAAELIAAGGDVTLCSRRGRSTGSWSSAPRARSTCPCGR